MDEQRFQAYVALIEQLLGCGNGEEGAILQQQAELMDAGLLAVMQQYADWLEQQGSPNAGWLRQFAQRLETALGGMNTQVEESLEEAEQFLWAVLQLVVDSQCNAQQVYAFLAQHQDSLNPALLQILPHVAAVLLAGELEQRPFVAAVLGEFGNLLWQFPLGQRWLNLELGIAAYQQCLTVMTQSAMPVEWAQTMNNLANIYKNRIRGNRAENIEQAIETYQQCLTVRMQSAMPVEWAQTMNNLALAYSERTRGDRAENIEQAIEVYQQCLTVMTQSAMPVEWAQTMNNLALAYSERIRGDRAENIEQAIEAYQQCLTVMTQSAMPVKWAQTMMNLAIAYLYRIRGDRAENIEQAIEAYKQCLTVSTQTAMPVEWAQTMMNLATTYLYRIRGDQAENIEQAIEAYKQCLTVSTQTAMPVEWAETMMNLATAYSERTRGDRAENIEQAIEAYKQCLTVMTQSAMPVKWAQTMNNLALAYSNRIRGDRAENIEQAIAYYQSSLKNFEPELLPHNCRKTARSLGNFYSDLRRWQEAILIYRKALQASEILYQSADLLDGKTAELTETADLPRRAAYALARSGNPKKATEILEQGRARSLSETLGRDRSNLSQLQQDHLALFTQYQDITNQFRNLEAQQRSRMISEERHSLTPEAFRTEALQLRQTLTETIEQIRQVEGYTDFLAQPDFNDIQQAVRSGVPLVYLVPTPSGSLALIVTPDDIAVLWLDDLTETSLREFLTVWFSAYDQSQTNYQGWLETIDQVTHQLWQLLMAPLIDYLKQHSFQQATLIPTGYLSLLPLHAAWTEDNTTPTKRRYAFDLIHFTYAPNALSLNAAHDIAQRTGADSILAIDEPKHRYQDSEGNYKDVNPLPNSTREVQTAIATFQNPKVLRHEQATREVALAVLPHIDILHCSCHGNANLQEPLESGLAMSGDGEAAILTLRDLLDLKLAENNQGGIRLAILSACETGLIGTKLADEAIGLPTGLLQAGVAGIIASLWSVSDLATAMLLVRFYHLWRGEKQLEPHQALRQAQQWLRDTTNGEKMEFFDQISTADFIKNELFNRFSDDQAIAFAHPFHWAAFTFVGV